ncbi:MAG: hypothetical protein ABR517_00615 [Thermoanaerobaculia bacterium]
MNRDRNHPGVLSIVAGREMIRPELEALWPGRDRLEWHRRSVFLA